MRHRFHFIEVPIRILVKMFKKLVVFVVFSSLGFTVRALSADSKFDCFHICKKYGAETDYNHKLSSCKCIIVDTMSDEEVARLKQNAEILDLIVVGKSAMRRKRGLSSSDSILGSEVPFRRSFKLGGGRLVNPISQRDAFDSLTNVRTRLHNLSRNRVNARTAQAQIDAIRNSLRDLSQRVVVLTPEQRARLAAERARRQQRLNLLRTNTSGRLINRPFLVGASANNTSEDNTENEESSNGTQGIITQPKELYD